MSNEYFPSSAESFPDPSEYEERMRIINGIRMEATGIIQALTENRPKEGDIDDALEYVHASTRLIRLRELSEAILVAAENNIPGESFFLDDECFVQAALDSIVEAYPTEWFDEHLEELDDAITIGTMAGTNDAIELLLPNDITDEDAQNLHFFPWRRDALELTGHEIYQRDTIEEVHHRTKLPNVIVVDSYLKGETSLPYRSISIKDLDYDFTQAASLQ